MRAATWESDEFPLSLAPRANTDRRVGASRVLQGLLSLKVGDPSVAGREQANDVDSRTRSSSTMRTASASATSTLPPTPDDEYGFGVAEDADLGEDAPEALEELREDALAFVVAGAYGDAVHGADGSDGVVDGGVALPSGDRVDIADEPTVMDGQSAVIDTFVERVLDEACDVNPACASAASSTAGAEVAPSNTDDVSLWHINDMGYVRHRDHGGRDIGRIQFFGSGNKNLSATCYKHTACKMLKASSKCDRHVMLRWLVAGETLPADATSEQRRAGGKAHIGAFVALLEAHRP